jgi:hypothetical protein
VCRRKAGAGPSARTGLKRERTQRSPGGRSSLTAIRRAQGLTAVIV